VADCPLIDRTVMLDVGFWLGWRFGKDPQPPVTTVSFRAAQFDSGDVVGGAVAFDGSF
jgi:hypothetical protein